ncbi:TonB-dependent receptor plug domain-containing protein [candidate division GN15 bacterium]|nr:TonB-dependent receptor plug domain-containing protein [candidate division GN15 bacterium]
MNHRPIRQLVVSLLVIVTALLPAQLSGQTTGADAQETRHARLTGRVTSAETGRPLPGASVTLENTRRSVTTDSTGLFQFDRIPVGEHTLTVTHVGFQSKSITHMITFVGRQSVNLSLAPQPIRLKDMTVTPGRFTIMEAGPALPQTLTRRDIETIPQFGEDVYRAVTRLPGIGSNDYSARFTVRGGEHDQVLVLLDGLELYEPFHLKDVDGGALSVIDVAAIEGIDLITGGFAAQYGDRMSGVFNIRTRTVPRDRRRAEAGLSFSTIRAMSEGTFDDNRGAWLFSGRRGYVDLVTGMTDDYQEIKPRYYDLLGKVTYRLGDSHILSAHVLHADDDLDYFHDFDEALTAYTSSYGWWRLHSGLHANLTVETIASLGSINHTRSGTGYSESSHSYQYTVNDSRDMDFAGIKQDWEWVPGERLLFRWGVDYRNEQATYDYVSEQRNRYLGRTSGFFYTIEDIDAQFGVAGETFGSFLSARVRPLKSITTELGVRYDRVSYTDDRLVSPRASLVWAMTATTNLRLGWGKYYQSQEMYELDVPDGDEHFHPAELAEHYVIGLEQQIQPGFDFRIEAYYKDLSSLAPDYRNWLYPLQVFPEAHLDRVQIDRTGGVAKGIELYAKHDTDSRFAWWASYSLAWSNEHAESFRYDGAAVPVNDNVPAVYDQRHTLYFDMSYRPNASWQLNLAWQYRTGWPYTEAEIVTDGNYYYISAGDLNGERYPAYHRLDLRLNRYFETSHGRVSLFVELINLYDRDNIRTYEYSFVANSHDDGYHLIRDEWHWFGILPSIGISWQVDW